MSREESEPGEAGAETSLDFADWVELLQSGDHERVCSALEAVGEELSFDGEKLGDTEAAALATALCTNSALQTLNFANNSIGAEGAAALAQTLCANSTLRTLMLWNNSIGAEGAAALARALSENSSLQTLYLFYNNIEADGASLLAQGLSDNSSLQSLSVSYNSVGDEGAAALAQTLSENSSLQILMLYDSNIGAEGATALANVLGENRSLQILDLGHNKIGAEGAAALANRLESNTHLQSLYLYDNNIGDEGAAALADGLESNNHLQSLFLDENNVGDEGAAALTMAMQGNRSCWKITGVQSGSLQSLVERNKKQHVEFVECGDVEKMRELREWGVPVDTFAGDGGKETALERAVKGGDERVVEVLRGWGAKPRMETVEMVRKAGWRKAWHWIGWSGQVDGAMEVALVMNAEEREVMFECGGMEAYEPTARWMTLPDEVMERVIGWVARGG